MTDAAKVATMARDSPERLLGILRLVLKELAAHEALRASAAAIIVEEMR